MADRVAADPRIGTEFAGYRIKRVLGRSGELSVVYLAEDGRGDREVALKLLAPRVAADADFRERFRIELPLAASLDHPNTIPLYEAGEAEGTLFIAMRYVEGADLAKRLARGPLSPAHALSILEPVADALEAAHAHRLIHGGVKPTNILTSDAGHVYLADFGIGRAHDQTCAAPEQCEDGEVSARTDVYALACVLFTCLTGEPPPSDDGNDARPYDERPVTASRNAEFPPGIDAVFAKGLATNPLDRHRSARELIDEARRVLMPYSEDAAPRMARRGKRRKRAALAVLVISAMLAIGVALAVLFAGGGSQGPGDRRPPPTDGALI